MSIKQSNFLATKLSKHCQINAFYEIIIQHVMGIPKFMCGWLNLNDCSKHVVSFYQPKNRELNGLSTTRRACIVLSINDGAG
jgi:hypothetical protein